LNSEVWQSAGILALLVIPDQVWDDEYGGI
jgi:hypothetical protein